MSIKVESISERVIVIIAAESGLPVDSIKLEANLADDISMDSLELVETVMAVEEEFGMEIPDEDAGEIKSVGDLIQYVESRSR